MSAQSEQASCPAVLQERDIFLLDFVVKFSEREILITLVHWLHVFEVVAGKLEDRLVLVDAADHWLLGSG